MDEDESAAERDLFEEVMAEKEEELRTLQELAQARGFSPRHSLARSPRKEGGLVAPLIPVPVTPTVPPRSQPPSGSSTGKRGLNSPEEVQEAVRRRMTEKKRFPVPPVSGILTTDPTPRAPSPSVQPPPPQASQASDAPSGLANMSKLQLLDMVHTAIKGIGVVTNATNKLNIGDKTTVASHSQDILAAVAALELQLADMEHQVAATKLQAATSELQWSQKAIAASSGVAPAPSGPSGPSYASALKMPRGRPPLEVQQHGPSVIFYPADDSLKSAEDTKKVLQQTIKPGADGIKIQSVRMVGNSGVVVRTADAEAAKKLKAAAPPTLKVADPKARLPRVALRYFRTDIAEDEFIEDLHKVNLADDCDWPLSKLKESCKVALKKQVGQKFMVLLECSMTLRDKLVQLGRIYIGWDVAEVSDHVRATCCLKCQQYGHPEKYCRSKEMVCGKCGDTGHKASECQSPTQCCATCKRFKRKDANTHLTAAASCPARLHAEQQAVNMLHYG